MDSITTGRWNVRKAGETRTGKEREALPLGFACMLATRAAGENTGLNTVEVEGCFVGVCNLYFLTMDFFLAKRIARALFWFFLITITVQVYLVF